MELRGSCNGCGACCKVLLLEQSPEEVRQMAALTRVLGIPSDHIFAAEHWRPLTRAEATALNPFYTSRLPADAHLYTCDRLGADGRCTVYEERPPVCRGYPWCDGAPPSSASHAAPRTWRVSGRAPAGFPGRWRWPGPT